MSGVSMHRKHELARRALMERLGVRRAMPGEVKWCTEWVPPVATAMTIQHQPPK